MLSDITEHKAEELLRNQMLLMKAIYDGIPDMLAPRPDPPSSPPTRPRNSAWAGPTSQPSSKCYHLLGFQSPCVDCACSFASDRGVPCMRNSESIATGRCMKSALPIMSVDGKTRSSSSSSSATHGEEVHRKGHDKLIDSLQLRSSSA
jgi:hypothetical protein